MHTKSLAQCLIQGRHLINVSCFSVQGRCKIINENKRKAIVSKENIKDQHNGQRNSCVFNEHVSVSQEQDLVLGDGLEGTAISCLIARQERHSLEELCYRVSHEGLKEHTAQKGDFWLDRRGFYLFIYENISQMHTIQPTQKHQYRQGHGPILN